MQTASPPNRGPLPLIPVGDIRPSCPLGYSPPPPVKIAGATSDCKMRQMPQDNIKTVQNSEDFRHNLAIWLLLYCKLCISRSVALQSKITMD